MLTQFITRWWKGKYISPQERSSDAIQVYCGVYERHWTSKVVHTIARFWLRNWKILLPVIVASVVALYIHFDGKSANNVAVDPNASKNDSSSHTTRN
jgi:hypothetical protein